MTEREPQSGADQAVTGVVDTDIHTRSRAERIVDFLPEAWRRRWLSGSRGAPLPGYWNPGGVVRSDAITADGEGLDFSPEGMAKEFLDAYGVDIAIVNHDGLSAALCPDPDYAAAMVSAFNDHHIADWLSADPRFRLSLVVSPMDPVRAAAEIHRLGDHPGVVQVLLPGGSILPYGHSFYHPIYEAAVAHDLPVATHPGTEGAGPTGQTSAAGYASRYLEWHTGLSNYVSAQLLSVVTEGVFQRFPTLRWVLLEGGVSWLPPLMWRFDKNWKALRRTTPWLDRPPSEIICERVRLSTQPLEEPPKLAHFRAMLEMFPAEEMLMFSSDFPHWDGDTPDFAGRAFAPAMRHRVMSETAREFYRLGPARG